MKKHTIPEIELKYRPVAKKDRVKVLNSQSAFELFLDNWNMDTIELFEEFKIVLLNRANEVIGIHTISKGGISGTIVDIRLIIAIAIKSASSSIILAHNHPSGNLKPSESDIRLHEKIKKATDLMDVQILDNLIITIDGYYSFADTGFK